MESLQDGCRQAEKGGAEMADAAPAGRATAGCVAPSSVAAAERSTEDAPAPTRPTASVPTAPDASSRKQRRTLRDRLNAVENRKVVLGIIATIVGGSFWGFSGTSASFIFSHYSIDTVWLMSVRQFFSGLLFLAVIMATDRKRFVQIWTTREDRRSLLIFTVFGLFLNQFCYLQAVRLTNAGTATILQCLEIIIVMGAACVRSRRMPRRRELVGIVLAFAGTFLIATGGNPAALSIPPEGLAMGLLTAVGAALIAVLPARILPKYGSSVVTGSAMLTSGIVCCLFVRPWENPPVLDRVGIEAMVVLIVVGSFLAYFFFLQGVKDAGAVRASLLSTVEPMSATLTSALMLGIAFSATDLIGFALIIVMVFLTV